ncbi:MAG: right-handed parallel beta-helix repeat-containing protein [Victivallaceae bacterium]|nr:right-handed parallel beta-helix repeat-containing protein [Victivallaceae bacterium]
MKRRDWVWMVLLLLGGLSGMAAEAGRSISVADFGAVPGDGKDDTQAVRKAFEYAAKHPAEVRKIVFPRGVYDFYEGAGGYHTPGRWVVWQDHLQDLEIDGGNSWFLIHGVQSLFCLNKSRNLTFKNFSVNHKHPYFSQGKVVGIAPDFRSFDLKLEPEFALCRKGGEPVPVFSEIDPATGMGVNGGVHVWHMTRKTELVTPDTYRLNLTGPVPALRKDMTILLRHYAYEGGVFRIGRSSDIVLENIAIHSGTSIAFVGMHLENLAFRNVRFAPAPESKWPQSISSDCIYLQSCGGTIEVDGCLFSGSHDDNFNAFTPYWSVEKILAPNKVVVRYPRVNSGMTPGEISGEKMDFLHADFQNYASRTIKAIRALPERRTEIEFTEALPEAFDRKNDLLMSHCTVKQITIRRSTFRNTRGRLCFQVPNVLVEDCTFDNDVMAAIQIHTSMSPWFEGGPSGKVVFRRNTMRNCGSNGGGRFPAVILITAESRNWSEAPKELSRCLSNWGILVKKPVHDTIEISGNVIDGSATGGMILSSARNVVVRDNLFKNLSRDRKKHIRPWLMNDRDWCDNAVTVATGIENLTFENNRCVDTDEPQRKGIFAVGLEVDPAQVHFQNNTGFEMVRKELFPEQKRALSTQK